MSQRKARAPRPAPYSRPSPRTPTNAVPAPVPPPAPPPAPRKPPASTVKREEPVSPLARFSTRLPADLTFGGGNTQWDFGDADELPSSQLRTDDAAALQQPETWSRQSTPDVDGVPNPFMDIGPAVGRPRPNLPSSDLPATPSLRPLIRPRIELKTPPRTVERPLSQESTPRSPLPPSTSSQQHHESQDSQKSESNSLPVRNPFLSSPFGDESSISHAPISAASIFEYVKMLETECDRRRRQVQALTKAREDLRQIVGTMQEEARRKVKFCEGCQKKI
ncbi:hypothetical protein BDZ88DRAFT_407961 [Geranomyces variabilis]|nr:hypothetical protein BDZ88DRAFT_407961 [Geranomyces variabilis]KAJ3142311.1 hypothetical protein HDU90_004584 [Geranomyces variabilis]